MQIFLKMASQRFMQRTEKSKNCVRILKWHQHRLSRYRIRPNNVEKFLAP